MSKNKKPQLKNILIVCEGEVTEPEYLKALKKLALASGIWDEIKIKPKPRSDQEQGEHRSKPQSSHKSPRLTRRLLGGTFDESDEVERRYDWKQTPTRYVKEARDGLKEGTFFEAWAVFDKDGHPAQEQAFALASEPIDGKAVRIAFSSVAFEQWILLHFEKNETAFVKSECKYVPENRRDEESLQCGTGTNPDDCYGVRCVSGYLRTKNYWKGSTKQGEELYETMTQLASPSLRKKAYENAAWLRFTVAYNPSKPYLTNPYSDVDGLAKRLLGEENQEIEWARLGETKIWQSLNIHAEVTASTIKLTLQNTGNNTMLLNGTDISIFLYKEGELAEELQPHSPDTRALSPGNPPSIYIFPIPDDLVGCDTFEIRRRENKLLFQL